MLQHFLQQAVAEADNERQLALLQQEEYSSYFVGTSFLLQLGGHVSCDFCPKGLVHFGRSNRIRGRAEKEGKR
ncbi:hypothetical protein TIFTF001_032949 [Ficus carica]|uniref:Uncharacterized protein n=1 Tax=Ficus carica TaxID=3494 RepID=A0AA88J8K9_FICCA|nr:hypothetical protein TIFTF001_032949 [Ficus carica]